MFSLQDYTRDYKKQAQFGIVPTDEQIKKIQSISLEMYKDLIRICRENDLRLMLGGGSALGAIRHGGFIPWDDDLDLMMPRADYDKLMEIFDSTDAGIKYRLKKPTADSDNASLFVQVVNQDTCKVEMLHNPKKPTEGIHVDIFALDYAAENRVVYWLKGMAANFLKFLYGSKMVWQGRTELSKRYFCTSLQSRMYYCFRIAVGFCTGIVSEQKITRAFDRIIACANPSARVTIPSGRRHYFGETLPADVFFPMREVSFEDTVAWVPNRCEEYLRNLYGDNYMDIPPIEKREYHPYLKLEV